MPAFAMHFSNSDALMRREALVMSGCSRPTPAAEQLHAAAGAGALDYGGLEVGRLAEGLGHRRGKGEDGRGADDPNLIAGMGKTRRGGKHEGGDRGGREASVDH